MFNKLRNSEVAKNSFFYTLIDIFNNIIPFILIPILTYYLTPSDYGTLAVFNSITSVVTVFIGQGIINAVSANYYKYSEEENRNYLGNVFFIVFVFYLIILAFILLLKNYLTNKLEIGLIWIFYAATLSLLALYVSIFLNILILNIKKIFYGFYLISLTISNFGFSLLLVIFFLLSWKGRIYGIFLSNILGVVFGFYYLIKKKLISFDINRTHIKDILIYYIPLIPHQLTGWLKSGATILIISSLTNKSDAGYYDIAMKFSMPLSILSVSFNKAWLPALYKKMSFDILFEDKKMIVKSIYLYFLFLFIIAFLLTKFMPIVIRLFLENSYINSIAFIGYLVFANAIGAMYPIFVNFIYYSKKTKYLSLISVSTAVINIALVYIMINIYGVIGAAYAFLTSSVITIVITAYYSNKIYPMPWFKIKYNDFKNL